VSTEQDFLDQKESDDALSDELLLGRFAKAQSQDAFAALVDRYAGLVLGTCRRRVGREDLAEDASQKVFLLLAKNAHRLRAPRTLAPWLYRMSILVCKGVIREEAQVRRTEDRLKDLSRGEFSPDLSLAVVLDAALAKLAKVDREAVILRYLYGLSPNEVSVALGTSPDAARMRIGRALKQLRGRLSAFGFVVGTEDLGVKLEGLVTTAPPGLVAKMQACSLSIQPSHVLHGSAGILRISKVALAMSTAVAAGVVFVNHLGSPATSTPFHAATYAVQPAGANRDPKFAIHKIDEQWVDPFRQRIIKYPYWQAGGVSADYLLQERDQQTFVTVRGRKGDPLTITKQQAIDGTEGGKWAQEPDLHLADCDFTKTEHFWKHSVVEKLPVVTVSSFGKSYSAQPVQVTEQGFFRVTGYLDVKTGKMVKEETYSRDAKGWYLVSYQDFEYSPIESAVFDPSQLGITGQFELAKSMPARRG
jgi:RNA polymerase sigma factor (sigma-70 family)